MGLFKNIFDKKAKQRQDEDDENNMVGRAQSEFFPQSQRKEAPAQAA
jgi:hypothetical protein